MKTWNDRVEFSIEPQSSMTTSALSKDDQQESNSARRVAIVEIGSRALRFLVADVWSHSRFTVVATDKGLTDLGKIINSGKGDMGALFDSIVESVEGYMERSRSLGASKVMVLGTEALRKLPKQVQDSLMQRLPNLTILDRKTEALYSLVAAVRGLPRLIRNGERVLVIDQGGGSTELVLGKLNGKDVEVIGFRSYKLGTQVLASILEESRRDLKKFRSDVADRIASYSLVSGANLADHVIVFGSAATRFAWVVVSRGSGNQYSPRRLHGQRLSLETLDKFLSATIAAPKVVREIMEADDPENVRYETVVSGLVGLAEFLRALGKREFVVSGWGLRYGALLSAAQDNTPKN